MSMKWEDGFALELTEDERMVQQAARDFAEQELRPIAAKMDHGHQFEMSLVPKLAELGFLGICTPEEFGGSGLSQVAYALIGEEIAAGCASTCVIISAHNSLCIWPILEFGNAEQKLNFLPDLATGKKVGCFALSEPGTGSDASNLQCTATKDGEDYIINGTKNWITNAPIAGTCVLLAMQDASKKHHGVNAFVHSMMLPGITVGKKEEKLGICASPTASIHYDNVRLSKANLLGNEGDGFTIAMKTLNGGRIGIGAQAVGIARSALRAAVEYGSQRKTFGKPIVEHQSIQNYLAEMICQIDAARYLTLGAARLKEQGKNYSRQAAMAKLFSSEMASFVCNKALQIHGGYGYVKEYPVERHLCDAKITEIYEGTSEIQKLVIAGQLLKDSN